MVDVDAMKRRLREQIVKGISEECDSTDDELPSLLQRAREVPFVMA